MTTPRKSPPFLRKIPRHLLLLGAVAASLGGTAFFLVLFLPDFNIYWLIFAPVIFAFYQAPAVFLYWLWKKHRPLPPKPAEKPDESSAIPGD